jgi:hypothetical protein
MAKLHEVSGSWAGEADSFAALRNDSQKGKGNSKGSSNYRGPSLRSG